MFELKLGFIDKDDICASFQCHEHFVETERHKSYKSIHKSV